MMKSTQYPGQRAQWPRYRRRKRLPMLPPLEIGTPGSGTRHQSSQDARIVSSEDGLLRSICPLITLT